MTPSAFYEMAVPFAGAALALGAVLILVGLGRLLAPHLSRQGWSE